VWLHLRCVQQTIREKTEIASNASHDLSNSMENICHA